MTRLLLSLAILAIGLALLAPFVGLGMALHYASHAMGRCTEAAAKALRHFAATVGGDEQP